MNIKEKIYLNKTLHLLRKLPDDNRIRLAAFIREEREHGITYIATEIFSYLTGSPSPKLRSIYTYNFTSLTGDFSTPSYLENAPYFEVTNDKQKSKEFYKGLLNTAKIMDKMTEEELDGYLNGIVKPHTAKEILNAKTRKVLYYIQKSLSIKVPHYIEMATNSRYRKFYKQLNKISQKVKE